MNASFRTNLARARRIGAAAAALVAGSAAPGQSAPGGVVPLPAQRAAALEAARAFIAPASGDFAERLAAMPDPYYTPPPTAPRARDPLDGISDADLLALLHPLIDARGVIDFRGTTFLRVGSGRVAVGGKIPVTYRDRTFEVTLQSAAGRSFVIGYGSASLEVRIR